MLVSEITLATRLGINIEESPDWHQVIGHLEEYKYNGIFSDYYKRWWWADVELWINKKLNCPIIKGLTSEKRVEIIKEKLGLERLMPIHKHLKPFKSKISSGWLRRYTAFAKSANIGGTLMSNEEFEERKAERQAQEKN